MLYTYCTAISATHVLAQWWYNGLATKCPRHTNPITSKDDMHFTPHGFLNGGFISKLLSKAYKLMQCTNITKYPIFAWSK